VNSNFLIEVEVDTKNDADDLTGQEVAVILEAVMLDSITKLPWVLDAEARYIR
jgi:hypothetical protein